ncbi:hypothetical protein IFM89_004777 [Coptis chinensis]|uniref:General transcription and DNA repair factor IIH subunit TFB5 n=1 Tax=Coptis chinensis TaxID=261450 RepID=A0A835HTL9_9MAGN|nr:hypothetical protein IFM89_004777 [Coptis chinensis]
MQSTSIEMNNMGNSFKAFRVYIMVNATKGLVISSDIPMVQFIINYNSSLPASQRFILHVLDNTHLFVLPNVGEMIRSAISEFRDQNSYEKPA